MYLNTKKAVNNKCLKFGTPVASLIYFRKVLDELSLSKKYIGYYCVLEIMDILINKESSVKSFTKDIYPIVSDRLRVAPCTIERNIRNLICKCWSLNLMEKLGVYYPKEKCPACREFVYLIKDYIEKTLA